MTKGDVMADGDMVIPFGQFDGKTIDEAASTEEGLKYLDWLLGSGFVRDARLQAALEQYMGQDVIRNELAAILLARGD